MLNANFTRTVWRVTYLQLACSDFAPIFALAAADITRFFLPVVLPLVRKALVRLPAAIYGRASSLRAQSPTGCRAFSACFSHFASSCLL